MMDDGEEGSEKKQKRCVFVFVFVVVFRAIGGDSLASWKRSKSDALMLRLEFCKN